MRKIKSLVAVVLLCVICFSLCACGISKKEAIGTWGGSYTYKGNKFVRTFVLGADDEYAEVTFKNGSMSSSEVGTYEVKGNKVILHKDGNKGISTIYKYKGGKLVNNDHEFSKVEK